MDGVSAWLCVRPPGVLVSIETELQVFGKRHGPGVVGERNHWRHLRRGAKTQHLQNLTFGHRFNPLLFLLTDLFADAAPGVVEDCVLITRNRRVQLLQHNLHTAAAVYKPPDVVHHGSLTEHAGALIGRPTHTQ